METTSSPTVSEKDLELTMAAAQSVSSGEGASCKDPRTLPAPLA